MGINYKLVGYGICARCGWSGSATGNKDIKVAIAVKDLHDQESDHCPICRIKHLVHVVIMKRGSNQEITRGHAGRSPRPGHYWFATRQTQFEFDIEIPNRFQGRSI